MPRMITIGQVTTSHGSRGELRVIPLTDFPDRFSRLKEVVVEHNGQRSVRRLESARPHKQFVILKLEGVEDPETAQRMRHALVQIPEEDLMPLPDGHYYIFQLIGLEVFTEAGEYLGKIDNVFQTGSNDVYRVLSDTGKEFLIPALKQVVTVIDLEQRRMVIRPLEGLLDG
ncbi:MAG: 16S rRNA processing protein RimM [Firmicutes bacterium]|nr:16S rRNA processing protein RimM [Bacillota bacterium]